MKIKLLSDIKVIIDNEELDSWNENSIYTAIATLEWYKWQHEDTIGYVLIDDKGETITVPESYVEIIYEKSDREIEFIN